MLDSLLKEPAAEEHTPLNSSFFSGMGVSAQHHRISVGVFGGGRLPALPWAGRGLTIKGWNILILASFLLLFAIVQAADFVPNSVEKHSFDQGVHDRVWAPNKETMVAEWNSPKFTVLR